MPEYGYQVAPAVDFLNSLLREERAPEVPEVDADLRPYLASLVVAARRNAKAERDAAALRRAEAAEARLGEAERLIRDYVGLVNRKAAPGDQATWEHLEAERDAAFEALEDFLACKGEESP